MEESNPKSFASLLGGSWSERLETVVDMMRQLSKITDPQKMVQTYSARMQQIIQSDSALSLSRRDLVYPHYRITRSTRWENSPNPWKAREKLPLFKGGALAELIYGEMPVVMDEIKLADDEPAREFIGNHRSLAAIPLYDQGHALNMIVLFRNGPAAFAREYLPEHLWLSNLFGRMTQNLVLSDELREAYAAVDREMQVVGDIQRSLLPTEMPTIPTLDLSAHYQTSRRAGGDYYDFFELPDGRWGFLIADVSGHGTPAAVLMAIMHSIAHTIHEQPDPPSRLLNFVNRHLSSRYTNGTGTFVTAFYGIYDPKRRTITYANAGHNPPRHKRADKLVLGSLEAAQNLPLGIDAQVVFADATQQFEIGDSIVFYTDGITEARNAQRELFGLDRLDELIVGSSEITAKALKDRVLTAVEAFTGGAPPNDDRTLLVARVRRA